MKHQLIRAACNFGAVLQTVFGPLRRESAHLLMYHRIAAPAPGVASPTLNVSPDQFERQLRGLVRRGYDFAPLNELVDLAEKGSDLPSKTLAVTFDDGYENMYTRVFPIIQRLRVPVTIFVCTKWLNTQEPMPFDEWGRQYRTQVPAESYRPLSWPQCEEMVDSGLVEIAAHTHSHEDFRGNEIEFAEDMQLCLELLSSQLGINPANFAFPFGRVDEGFATGEMVNVAKALGVRSALTTEPGPVTNEKSPFHWGRNNVFAWDSAATIDARLTGWYQWLPKWRRRLRQVLRLARHPLETGLSTDQPLMGNADADEHNQTEVRL